MSEMQPIKAARPIGADAPKHSVEGANYAAACIAARQVRGRAIHSEEHRQSLEAWERGERAWPWPDASPADLRLSHQDVAELVKGHLRYDKQGVTGECASRRTALVLNGASKLSPPSGGPSTFAKRGR